MKKTDNLLEKKSMLDLIYDFEFFAWIEEEGFKLSLQEEKIICFRKTTRKRVINLKIEKVGQDFYCVDYSNIYYLENKIRNKSSIVKQYQLYSRRGQLFNKIRYRTEELDVVFSSTK